MLRLLLLFVVWAALALPLGLILLPLTLLTRNGALLYRCGTLIAMLGLRCVGIRAVVENRGGSLPAGACLFFSNHVSNLDPPLLAAALLPRRLAMLAKQELLRIPLLGWGMRLTGFVPVARSGSPEAAKESIARAEAVLNAGISVAVFVEGTRSPNGRLLPFKRGPFYLAMQSRKLVVPVTILGASELWPKGRMRLQSGVVRIVLHAAIDPCEFGDRNELRDAVRAAIASALPVDSADEHQGRM